MNLLFFNISGGEFLIIILIILLVFGPDKIPEIARFLGKSINEVKRASMQIREEIQRETMRMGRSIEPLTDQVEKDEYNDSTVGSVTGKGKDQTSVTPPYSVSVENPYRLTEEEQKAEQTDSLPDVTERSEHS